MAGGVLKRSWQAVAADVGGRGDQREAHFKQPPDDKARYRRAADAQGEVNAFANEIAHVVIEDDVKADLGVARAVFAHPVGKDGVGAPAGRGQAQMALRRFAAAARLRRRGVQQL